MEMTNMDVSESSSIPPPAADVPLDLAEDDAPETSPVRGGPPSETSSHEWDTVSNPAV
jgi:mitochondrial import receptor subunit TOM20